MKKPILLLLSFIVIIVSCKKETTEDIQSQEENKPFVIKLRNKTFSEHVIQKFETRCKNDHLDEDGEWSDNHLNLGAFIVPNDSVYLSFQSFSGPYCEFRLGVITPEGFIVNLDEQEGYTFGNYPNFSWSHGDTLELALTIVTDNTGYIYIRDY